jgi:hypothetical protein
VPVFCVMLIGRSIFIFTSWHLAGELFAFLVKVVLYLGTISFPINFSAFFISAVPIFRLKIFNFVFWRLSFTVKVLWSIHGDVFFIEGVIEFVWDGVGVIFWVGRIIRGVLVIGFELGCGIFIGVWRVVWLVCRWGFGRGGWRDAREFR